MDRGAWRAAVHGVTESDTTEQLSTAAPQNQVFSPFVLLYDKHQDVCLTLCGL